MTVEEIVERAAAIFQSEGADAAKAFYFHEMEKLLAEGVPVAEQLQDSIDELRVDNVARAYRIAIYGKALERLPAAQFFTAGEVAAMGREVLRDAGIVDDAADEEPAPS